MPRLFSKTALVSGLLSRVPFGFTRPTFWRGIYAFDSERLASNSSRTKNQQVTAIATHEHELR
jgi:hypothetical protein